MSVEYPDEVGVNLNDKSGRVECANSPDCEGDGRYVAPGRNHAPWCKYPFLRFGTGGTIVKVGPPDWEPVPVDCDPEWVTPGVITADLVCAMDPTQPDLNTADLDLTYPRRLTVDECDHPVTVTAPLDVWVGFTHMGTTDPITVCLGCNHATDPDPEDQT